MIQADFIVEGAAELLTLGTSSNRPRRGDEMQDLGIIRDGAVAARRGKIVWLGPASDLGSGRPPLSWISIHPSAFAFWPE